MDTTDAPTSESARKAFEALDLHLQGKTLQEIADTVGYQHRSAARKAYLRALKYRDAELAEVTQHGRARAHARYELLFRPAAEKALAGDMKAMGQAIKLADRLANIEGVKPPEETLRVQITDQLDREIETLAAALDRAAQAEAVNTPWQGPQDADR